MAIKKQIEIDVEADDKAIDKLTEAVKKLSDNIDNMGKSGKESLEEVEDAADKAGDAVKDVGDSAKKSKGGLSRLTGGVKAFAKAAGIFFIVGEALNLLREIFGKNQKVVDLFNTSFNTLTIMFNDLVGLITDNFQPAVDKISNAFVNWQDTLKSFGTAIKNNLIERFESFIDTLGFAGKGLVKFFKGDFSGAVEEFKKAGKESIDVLTGVDDSFDKIGEVVEDATEAIVDYTKETVKKGKAITENNKALELLGVQMELNKLKYQEEAEIQRQLRDDTSRSIEDRIEANRKLGAILDEQAQNELEMAESVLAGIELELHGQEENIELQQKYLEARLRVSEINERITGQRSEQLVNEIGLQDELIEKQIEERELKEEELDRFAELHLTAANAFFALQSASGAVKSALESVFEDLPQTFEAAMNQVLDNKRWGLMTDAVKDIFSSEELDALHEANFSGYEEKGYAAFRSLIQGQIDELTTFQEIEKGLRVAGFESRVEDYEKQIELLKDVLSKESILATDHLIKLEDIQKEKSEAQFNSIMGAAQLTSNVLASIQTSNEEEAKRMFKITKALNLGMAIASTANAVIGALAPTGTDVAIPFYVRAANAVAAAATGAAQIGTIANQQFGSALPGTPTGGGGTAVAPVQPQFNLVGQGIDSQIAGGIIRSGKRGEVLRAYVVEKDITSAQQLQRQVDTDSSFG